uniref:Putative ethylene-insensitive protein 2 n=1 Tax=Davidia involucrata TaxID=16924 RepID=A0A5B6ZWQ5_DAVIN
METEILTANHQRNILQRLLPAVVPVLLIAIGYVDPGKWAAAVEGGARFGFDLVALMLLFNFAAILYQYLSARIAVVTGRDLAQICSEEYDKATCIFLGVQTEFSMIALDLTMIMGTAHGLNLIFGVDLFTCVFLTAVDAVIFPLFATLLENGKAKLLCICMASFILLCYVFGVLISQPEIPISMSGMLTKLSGESAFTLMSLLGANIMPHNFYLHSSIVQQDLGPPNVSKGALCHDHFFAILCIFSGIFLVNYVLMNSAANVFHSTGLVLLTFQDALSLMDQVFRSPIAPIGFLLVLFFSNQITALTWNLGRQAVLLDFFGMDIPGWLHHAIIRIVAIVPALYCVWNSGAEGIYQLLIFTQVMVALVLPSSVIPVFRVASSRSIMGVYKISQFVEFLALISFIGMLGLKIIFVVEMIFGNSDWAGNLRWNFGNSISVPYIVLLITASASFCLMLWLAATPLKSASSRLDAQVWNWDIQNAVPESSVERDGSGLSETRYHGEQPIQKQEPMLALGKSLESHSDMSITSTDLNLPETLLDSDNVPHLTTVEEGCSNITFSSPSECHLEESETTVETVPVSTVCNKVLDGESLDTSTLKTESMDLIEKTVRVEGDLQTEKDDEGDTWEPEESSKGVSGSSPSLTSEGPGSFRNLGGKSDDGGSGAGSLSRLAGLGRAARRQLAAALDEFWGQLYDFHGQATQEAKAKKLDVLLGIDSKIDSKPATMLKVDTGEKEFTGYFPCVGGRGSDSVISSNLYDSPKQQGLQRSIESSYGVQGGSPSLWSNPMQMLDAYVQNSSRNALGSGERRNSGLRLPPSSDGYDYQPATVHGYQIASYLSRIAKEKGSDHLNNQMDSLTPKSPSLGMSNYRDSLAFALGQKPQNRLSNAKPPGFTNLAVSRNSSLQSERPFYDLCSSGLAENVSGTVNEKKFHSLPDISGLLPHRDSYLSDRSAQWDSPIGYGPSVGRTMYEPSLYSNTSSRAGAPLAFDELSPSKVCRNAFSLQFSSNSGTGSLWSRQPFEQFGMTDRTRAVGVEEVGSRHSSNAQETTSIVDLEAKLLQSFRLCTVKLLKLEGSDWLFRQNDGADEDLIDRVAAREKFLYEAETREMNRGGHMGEFRYSSDRKPGFASKNDDMDYTKFLVSSVPHCGEGCIWRVDLIISFGVWCIHRILELSLMESRPELWGKYTYVLNRLQGIVDLAFLKPHSPMTPCFCLQIPVARQQRSSPPISNGSLPPPVKQGSRGKCTTAAMVLEIIKDVELAISCRKGRTGTAAGDVAFPKGKENLASVLKRYKRRLSNKPIAGTHEGGSGSRKIPASASYGS